VAAIDAGTNTFRLLVADSPETVLAPRCKEQEIPRLGEGFAPHGRLQEAAMARGLAVMARFAARLAACRPLRVRAVATSVVREAANGGEFIARVRRETGIPLEVIDGEEEASLTALGVWRSLPPTGGPLFLFDIGGGSTEFTYLAADGRRCFSRSCPFGVVKLTEQYLVDDPPAAAAARQLTAAVDLYLDQLFSSLAAAGLYPFAREVTLVGSAGTMTTFAAVDQELAVYEPARVHGCRLSRERLAVLHERLWRLPRPARARVPGLEPGRADVILAGGLIALRIMDRAGFSRVTVSDCSLLEGIAFSLFGAGEPPSACM